MLLHEDRVRPRAADLRPGDRLRCLVTGSGVIEDNIYTVRRVDDISNCNDEDTLIYLEELLPDDSACLYRFVRADPAPVVTRPLTSEDVLVPGMRLLCVESNNVCEDTEICEGVTYIIRSLDEGGFPILTSDLEDDTSGWPKYSFHLVIGGMDYSLPSLPATPKPKPKLSQHFDAAFLKFIEEYPGHPMVKAALARLGKLPEATPVDLAGWDAWYAGIETTAPVAPVHYAPPPSTSRRRSGSGVRVNVTEMGVERGNCSYRASYTRDWEIEIPDSVLEEAAENEDPSVIEDWVNENYYNGESGDYDTDDFIYDDHYSDDSEATGSNVDRSGIREAYAAAIERFGNTEDSE